MAKRLPVDEWLFPNINTGCVIKFNERGKVWKSLWDLGGINHPDDHLDARHHSVSIWRHPEQPHRPLQAARRRSRFRALRRALGPALVISLMREFANRFLGRGDATIAVPSFDGVLKPNQKLEEAEILFECAAPEDLATDGRTIYLADGPRLLRLDGGSATELRVFEEPISALASLPGGELAVALGGREVSIFPEPSAAKPRAIFATGLQRGQCARACARRHADRDRRLHDAQRRRMGLGPHGARSQR